VAEIRARMAARVLSASHLADQCGVDQSQISRVLAGGFKGLSHNMMQICIYLGIDPLRFVVPSREDEMVRRRIIESALAVWDGTPEGADLLVSILAGIAAIRETRRK
jgi:transcriptional regulator with XRE-family HTH domain